MDSRKCQTSTASPAEPGELPVGLGGGSEGAPKPNAFPRRVILQATKTRGRITPTSFGWKEIGMADRKQFSNVVAPDAELVRLLDSTRDVQVTDEQLREQRMSFAFGNAQHTLDITRDSVVRSSESMRLRA